MNFYQLGRQSNFVMSENQKATSRFRLATSALITFEGILVLSGGAFLIVESFISEAKNPDALLVEILFAILAGIGLLFAALGIKRKKRYGYSPALLANFIAFAVSFYLREADRILLANLLALISATAVVSIILLSRPTSKE
jgi:uncharacterized membrane protein